MKHILLVEDDPRISSALAIRLRQAGYEVKIAPDPKCGVSLAVEQPPDLIITDLYLPQMNGFNFVNQLKTMGLNEVPFMVITASQRDGLWESARELGAAGYFEKPYDPARLMATVGSILNTTNHAPHNCAQLRP